MSYLLDDPETRRAKKNFKDKYPGFTKIARKLGDDIPYWTWDHDRVMRFIESNLEHRLNEQKYPNYIDGEEVNPPIEHLGENREILPKEIEPNQDTLLVARELFKKLRDDGYVDQQMAADLYNFMQKQGIGRDDLEG